MKNGNELIGKTAYIKNIGSSFDGQWGIVTYFDGEYYHLAMFGDKDSLPIFSRNEFTIRRERKEQ